jgi:hypothetical protein
MEANMLEGQEMQAVKVECEHDHREREWREKEEREREQKRAQTVGQLVDALAQNNNRNEMKDTLCQILDRARALFADDEVCRGALVIAATAIMATQSNGFIYRWRGEQLTKYLVLLANELQAARGAGYFDLDTRARLDRITDILPGEEDDDYCWEWSSPDRTLGYYACAITL